MWRCPGSSRWRTQCFDWVGIDRQIWLRRAVITFLVEVQSPFGAETFCTSLAFARVADLKKGPDFVTFRSREKMKIIHGWEFRIVPLGEHIAVSGGKTSSLGDSMVSKKGTHLLCFRFWQTAKYCGWWKRYQHSEDQALTFIKELAGQSACSRVFHFRGGIASQGARKLKRAKLHNQGSRCFLW